jgi:hypothetical protein
MSTDFRPMKHRKWHFRALHGAGMPTFGQGRLSLLEEVHKLKFKGITMKTGCRVLHLRVARTSVNVKCVIHILDSQMARAPSP